MNLFFRIFKHLLPSGRAWRLTTPKQLRDFFAGLTDLGQDSSDFFDGIYRDLDPQLTRELSAWEQQFGLVNTLSNEQERRDRLDAAWKAVGGQSPRYIQDTLQGAGFNVFVHHWWVPGSEAAIGVNAAATPRNPLLILHDGIDFLKYDSIDGGLDMQDGDALAQDGGTLDPSGYPLVNKNLISVFTGSSDGSESMMDGDPNAQDGGQIITYELRSYIIPTDVTLHPYFLYIGGETFPEHATLTQSRRNEFETLCLKICPAQLWLGILVDYT